MKKLFSILIFAIGIMAFSGVNAENKGSPAGIENSISQSIEVPAFANIEAISVSEVTAFDSGICAYLICQVNEPVETFIAVDSGRGYKRMSLSNYENSDLSGVTNKIPIALSGGQGFTYLSA